ncbi:MFS transporter [Exiguobacterium sp. SH31]|uniref:MFS transporter n=1 Tax=Exiguobacterium sp. SH31 TaxID=1843183 RepID=UPI0008B34481|nr:MFS transporter [Exiguobacterium sp. SH31]OGX79571.1 MFS transporter [Exiguobacterium sp. SH31]
MSTSPVSQPSFEAKKERIPYWWKVIAVFFLGWMFMYADRTILNPVMPNLAQEFGLNNAQLGLVNSVFFLTYAIAQIPSGSLGDKFGRKRILVPGFILFGLFTGITGLASTFLLFMIARAITGLGEGTYYGPQYALSSEAIPKQFLTIGTAIINSGMALGISLGYISSSYLTLELGMSWRTPFYFMTIPTILTGILIWYVVKEKRPERVANTVGKSDFSIMSLFKNRNLLATFVMVFCSLYGFFMILTWLPQYLQVERGFQGSDVGFISSLVPWASIPGALLIGYLSDKMGKKKPLVFVLVPLSIASILAVVFVESTPLLFAALILYGLTGKLALDPVLLSFVANNAPKKVYGTVFGVYNFVGMTSSILAPYLTGYLVDQSGSMQTGFYLAAVLLVIGMIAMLFTKETVKPAEA